MRFMMFVKHVRDYADAEVPSALYAAMDGLVTESIADGVMLDGAGLEPLAEAARVQLANGKVTVTDGPYTESKEIVGGYALCEFGTREEAVAFATKFMELHRVHWPEFEGEVEVRALQGSGA